MWTLLLLMGCSPKVTTGVHTLGEQSAGWSAYVPESDGGAAGAVVLLPADNSDHGWLPRRPALRRWARESGFVVFSMDAPQPGGIGCWWSPHKHGRGAFVASAVDHVVVGQLGADPERLVLGGWSGGAFLAFGAPFYVEMPGVVGLVGVCGADVPRADSDIDWCQVDETQDDPPLVIADEQLSAVAGGRRVYLARNEDDDWVEAIDQAAELWRVGGASVRLESAGEGGHCALDVVDHLVEGAEWVTQP